MHDADLGRWSTADRGEMLRDLGLCCRGDATNADSLVGGCAAEAETTRDEVVDDLKSDRGVVVSLPVTSIPFMAPMLQLQVGPHAESGDDGVSSALAVVESLMLTGVPVRSEQAAGEPG
jgi:hypothetical protein